jgi:hypothetical protein
MSHPFNTTPAGFFIKLDNLHEHMRNIPPFHSVLIDDGGAAAQEFKRQMSEPLP